MSLAERFWARTDKRGPDDCWPWLGSLNSKGYGQLSYKDQKLRAHAISFDLHGGVLPVVIGARSVVMHTCDNPICVNPAHLVGGTQSQNMKDAVSKGRLPLVSRLVEQGKEAAMRKAEKKAEYERKKALGPQLGPDGKYRDYMGRMCRPGQINPEPVRDSFGRLTKNKLPDPQRDAEGRFK
jgi:hypothetical protein